MQEFLKKLAALVRRREIDTGLEEEIRFHMAERADELENDGLPRRQADLQARREFGHALGISEQGREAWQFRWLEDLIKDLHYAARSLRRTPGFALAAVLSLALGIGVNTSIFSLAVEFLLSEPSARKPSELFFAYLGGNSHQEYRSYEFLRDTGLVPGMAGQSEENEAAWRNGDRTESLYPMFVTRNYFDVVGTPLSMGRGIRPDDEAATVITHRFWQSRLNGDPGVLGRSLHLNGQPYTIVGVLPPVHRTLLGFGFAPDLYLPILKPNRFVMLVIRGASRQEITSRIKVAAQAMDRAMPRGGGDTWAGDIRVFPTAGWGLWSEQSEFMAVAAFFLVLLILVGLVLLLACANVSGMLLARATARWHELAIRQSIGAGRGRLVRQLLAESLLLASAGALAGLALNLILARWAAQTTLPVPVPIRLQIEPDWRLLGYAILVSAAAAVFSGLGPALRATRGALNPMLKSIERQAGGRRFGVRSVLVAGQIAVSAVLLLCGFLFLRNLSASASMELGFDTRETLAASISVSRDRFDAGVPHAYADEALRKVRGVPGVLGAAIVERLPLNDQATMGHTAGSDGLKESIPIKYHSNRVSPGYFQTMGIPFVSGRDFTDADRRGGASVAIINETMARRLFPNSNPVGKRFWDAGDGSRMGWTIVGVVRNSKYFTIGEEGKLALYWPIAQRETVRNRFTMVIRVSGPPEVLLRPVEAALTGHDSAAAVEVKPISQKLAFGLLPSRAGALLFGSIGAVGLLLASVGLYGVVAYTIARRTKEIGLRIAVGASSTDIVKSVLRESLVLLPREPSPAWLPRP